MENKNHQCYSCGLIISSSELAAECMCINKITDMNKAKYRGICINCKNVPYKNWKTQPNFQNHHLQKIHTYTKEYNEHWEIIKNSTNNGSWSGMTSKNGYDTYNFLVGPNGETNSNEIFSQMPIDEYNKYKKSFTIESFKGFTCTSECCPRVH